MSSLKVLLFGSPQVEYKGEAVVVDRRKPLALLAYLAVTAERHRRDTLATLLWPDSTQSSARAGLRRDLSMLKKALGGEWLEIDRETVALRQASDLWFDIEQFQQNLAVGRTHDHAPDEVCVDCLPSLTEAVTLYRNDFLAGFTLSDSPDFDEWQFFQAESLRQALASTLERLVRGYSAQQDFETAIPYARRRLALDALHEPAHQQLMQLYAWTDQWAAALRQYQECERILKEDAGVPPSAETTALHESIKEKRLSPPTEAKEQKGTAPFTRAGEATPFVPVSLRASTSAPLHNLPIQPTPFIGREAELEAVQVELSRPEVRLLTLTGPGGTGKTRLGLQAATNLSDDFEDGVFFVALASISDPVLVGPTIAETLEVREAGDTAITDLLQEHLQAKHRLLVLDNFEHLMPAAPLITALLEVAPKLKILVTSRILLRLSGEWDYPVPSLSLPDPKKLPSLKHLTHYEAIRFFIERARAVKINFGLTEENAPAVAEICLKLDGLPLAIELAAARVRVLPPQKILSQLSSRLQFLTGGARDLPARQQTLRNSIDWSYNLLGETEQLFLQRLAVFASGCTLEAAQAVGGFPNEVTTLNLLESLVDKNLLDQIEVAGEPRFRMLETIREYALERLVEDGEAEVIRRHLANYFVDLAETAESNLNGPQETIWIKRLELEHDNLRAALAWSIDNDIEAGLPLAASLGHFWHITGHHNEGINWLAKALSNTKDSQSNLDSYRAKALNKAGYLAYHFGDIAQASTLGEKSVTIWRQVGDQRGLANALRDLGAAVAMQDDNSKALTYLEESIALFRQLGDKRGLVRSLFWYAMVAFQQRDYKSARTLLEESSILAWEVGDVINIGSTMGVLGTIELREGNFAKASSLMEESLTLMRQAGDMLGIAINLDLLGGLAYRQSHFQQAREYFAESLLIWRNSGSQVEVGWVLYNLGYVAIKQKQWSDAVSLLKEGLSLNYKQGRMQTVAACLAGLATVATGEENLERATRLCGATQAFLESLGTNLEATDPDRYDRVVVTSHQIEFEHNITTVRATLGDEAFGRAWGAGQAMSLEQAMTFALNG